MTDNLQKYITAFRDSFESAPEQLEHLEYQSIPDWDSVGHLTLVSNIEIAFGISMEMDDITDLSSFSKGKEILKKYNVEME